MKVNVGTIDSNNKLVISVEGSIDTVTAAEFEKEVKAGIATAKELILDFSSVDYVSSAGLRAIISLNDFMDSKGKMIVKNVNDDVHEVFEMTGFTSIINVNRKMREISIEGLDCIGEGSVGKIYRLDADTIVKVFVNADSAQPLFLLVMHGLIYA